MITSIGYVFNHIPDPALSSLIHYFTTFCKKEIVILFNRQGSSICSKLSTMKHGNCDTVRIGNQGEVLKNYVKSTSLLDQKWTPSRKQMF
jgi:hypothetical protein